MLEINHKQIEIDQKSMKDMGNGVIVISDGQAVMYPAPKYGKIEIAFQNYKHSRPHYDIVAE